MRVLNNWRSDMEQHLREDEQICSECRGIGSLPHNCEENKDWYYDKEIEDEVSFCTKGCTKEGKRPKDLTDMCKSCRGRGKRPNFRFIVLSDLNVLGTANSVDELELLMDKNREAQIREDYMWWFVDPEKSNDPPSQYHHAHHNLNFYSSGRYFYVIDFNSLDESMSWLRAKMAQRIPFYTGSLMGPLRLESIKHRMQTGI